MNSINPSVWYSGIPWTVRRKGGGQERRGKGEGRGGEREGRGKGGEGEGRIESRA